MLSLRELRSPQPNDRANTVLPLETGKICLDIYYWRTIGFAIYTFCGLGFLGLALLFEKLLASHKVGTALLWSFGSSLIMLAVAAVIGATLDEHIDKIPLEVRLVIIPLMFVFYALMGLVALPVVIFALNRLT